MGWFDIVRDWSKVKDLKQVYRKQLATIARGNTITVRGSDPLAIRALMEILKESPGLFEVMSFQASGKAPELSILKTTDSKRKFAKDTYDLLGPSRIGAEDLAVLDSLLKEATTDRTEADKSAEQLVSKV